MRPEVRALGRWKGRKAGRAIANAVPEGPATAGFCPLFPKKGNGPGGI
jgi:hypothetical protein